jgi:hypothetical protein
LGKLHRWWTWWLQASMDESFCFLYCHPDNCLSDGGLGESSHETCDLDSVTQCGWVLTSFWHQLCGTWNLCSLQYNTYPNPVLPKIAGKQTQIWFKLLLAGFVLLSRCPFECIFQASLLNLKITWIDCF